MWLRERRLVVGWGMRPTSLSGNPWRISARPGGDREIRGGTGLQCDAARTVQTRPRSVPSCWNPVVSPWGGQLYFISDRGGPMNLWRVRIDERTGKTRGNPEPVTVPVSYMKYSSWSGDGKKFLFSQAQHRNTLFSIAFDPA